MPELSDIVVYIESLERLLEGHRVAKEIARSPSLMRTFEPAMEDICGVRIQSFRRIGKRIVWIMENNIALVFHLMIAGRFHWRKPDRMPASG